MLVENIAYLTKRLQIQNAINTSVSRNQLHELKSLNFLLFEEFDASEAGELEKNLLEVIKVITKIGQQSKSADFKKLIADPLSGVLSAETVPDPSDENAVNEFVSNVRNGADEIAKLINALERTKASLGAPPTEGADEPIVDKLATDKEAADKLLKAIKAAYATPEWFTKAWGLGAKEAEKEAEGFFGKIKGFFGKLFKKKTKSAIKPDNVAKGILSMTFVDLDNINIEAAKKALVGETKQVAADTTDLTGSAIADDAPGGGGQDLEALAAKYKELLQDMAKEDPEAAKEELAEPAEELGLTPDELQGAIEDPGTLDDLASEKEIDPEDVKAAIEDAAKEADPDVPLSNDEIEELDPTDEIEAAEEAGLTGPKAAIASMMKNWANNLSATSKKSLATKGRGASLQQGIFDAIDATEPEIISLVKNAVAGWRAEHEETLVKSKRFATKNFVSLEDLIPKMVSTILTRANEAYTLTTRQLVYGFVHKCLDIRYRNPSNNYFSRLNELAGLPTLRRSIHEQDDKEKIEIKNPYKRSEFEDKLEAAFGKEFPDFKGDVAALMAMAMGDYVKNEVEEIVLERNVLSLLLYEKYDFKAIAEYMKDQMGDLPDDAGITGKEDAVIADFLRSIEPILGEDDIEITGIPKDSTENQEEKPGAVTDKQKEEIGVTLGDLQLAYEEEAAEDEGAALEKLEEPAQALEIPPEKLVDILDDDEPAELEAIIGDKELDTDAIIDTLEAAEEELAEQPPEGGEEPKSEEGEEPQTEEELEVEADPAEEIQAAIDAGIGAKDSVAKALTDWEQSLSKTSQSSLQTKKRAVTLKDAIFGAIDTAGGKLELAVRTAVANWRAEHEEMLLRSKRFAKKNFDSLEELIPQLAAAVLMKANESHLRCVTFIMVEKAVHNYLDRRFGNEALLQEFNRMNKLAGLIE